MAVKQFKFTVDGLKRLEEELDRLKTVTRAEVSEKIKVARSFGDLSENSEYDEAKNEQGKLYSKIAEIKELIENAEIVDAIEGLSKDSVTLGSKITVRDMADDFEESYEIVGSQEANPMQGRISDDSPVGRALHGHKAGDIVTVNAPAGEIKLQILSVENN